MPRPKTITLTADTSTTQASSPYPLNWRSRDFNVSLYFDTDGATSSFNIEYTLSDPEGSYTTDFATNAVWVQETTITGLSADNPYQIPVAARALRLTSDAGGSDSATLQIIQQG